MAEKIHTEEDVRRCNDILKKKYNDRSMDDYLFAHNYLISKTSHKDKYEQADTKLKAHALEYMRNLMKSGNNLSPQQINDIKQNAQTFINILGKDNSGATNPVAMEFSQWLERRDFEAKATKSQEKTSAAKTENKTETISQNKYSINMDRVGDTATALLIPGIFFAGGMQLGLPVSTSLAAAATVSATAVGALGLVVGAQKLKNKIKNGFSKAREAKKQKAMEQQKEKSKQSLWQKIKNKAKSINTDRITDTACALLIPGMFFAGGMQLGLPVGTSLAAAATVSAAAVGTLGLVVGAQKLKNKIKNSFLKAREAKKQKAMEQQKTKSKQSLWQKIKNINSDRVTDAGFALLVPGIFFAGGMQLGLPASTSLAAAATVSAAALGVTGLVVAGQNIVNKISNKLSKKSAVKEKIKQNIQEKAAEVHKKLEHLNDEKSFGQKQPAVATRRIPVSSNENIPGRFNGRNGYE